MYRKIIKTMLVFILIILLGLLDYHISCVYLDNLKIPRNLTLSIKSCGLVIDLTIFLLTIQLLIIYQLYRYKKEKITFIYS